jgi:hypothetical protein
MTLGEIRVMIELAENILDDKPVRFPEGVIDRALARTVIELAERAGLMRDDGK